MNPIVQKMPESFVFDEGLTDEAITGTTSLSKPGIDDRRSCRRTVPQVRQSCELKVGSIVLSASVVNESKTGFSVLIDRLDGLKAGKKVEFNTNRGGSRFRLSTSIKSPRPETLLPNVTLGSGWGSRSSSGYSSNDFHNSSVVAAPTYRRHWHRKVDWNRECEGSAFASALDRYLPTCRGFFVADRKAPLIRKQAGHFSGRILLPSSMKIPGIGGRSVPVAFFLS